VPSRIVVRIRDKTEITQANRSIRPSARVKRRRRKWACADEMVAQRDARPLLLARKLLQKTRSTHPSNWIDYRLATKYPASHRKPYGCVTKMHEPHRHPHVIRPYPQGEDQHHYREIIRRKTCWEGHNSAIEWHGSNTTACEASKSGG